MPKAVYRLRDDGDYDFCALFSDEEIEKGQTNRGDVADEYAYRCTMTTDDAYITKTFEDISHVTDVLIGDSNIADKKIKMICSKCGSADVRKDADAIWNIEKQEWELVVVYDNSTCEDCGGECSLFEEEII
ncbi:MAG: hypothetical protein WC119_00730 [Synergistaceae bacterium]